MEPTPDLAVTVDAGADADGDGDAARGTYGRFISLGVIGRGGMGVVLRARDPELDRQVAIKVLGPAWTTDSTSSQRLQREAQAMAKLSHPNVVAVYEMGQIGSERFIAMELVEGSTLRRWLAAPGRRWREIVAALVECGRGLAAAHAAGLVHRDFKPENVLIGADGRPRVTDFGLVAGDATVAAAAEAVPAGSSDLTVRGSVLGTPAYMAPEQWTGGEVDARTDQFAFCVSLWEALFGERPFAGTTGTEIRTRVLAGEIGEPPRDRKGGRALVPILRRGLARDRGARWPSMTALLDQLRPRRPRWPWVAGAAVVIGAAVAAAAVFGRSPADPCPDPAPRLASVWDDAIRTRITAQLAAANPAIAADVGARITPALDRYASRWRDASRAACRATRVDGTQSAELLDRRMLCLDRRRAELASLTAALATADHDRVATSIDAVGALGDLDQCANREMLLLSAPPTDPAQRGKVDALEAEIAASFASRFTAKPADREARAGAALTAAQALGYPPVVVHALEELFRAAHDNTDFKEMERALRELAQRAAESRDDILAARAWIELIELLARTDRSGEATTLEPVAEAAVSRAGSPPASRHAITVALAIRRSYSQDFVGALAKLHDALATATTDVERASVQQLLAQTTFQKDGAAGALPVAQQSLAAIETAYGPNHPETATGLHLMAQLWTGTGELDKARDAETRALAIREAALGPEHREVGKSLHTLGNIADNRGDRDTARKSFERAIEIFDKNHAVSDAALSRGALAIIVGQSDGMNAARPLFVAALDGLAATVGKDKINYAQTETNFAVQLITAGKCDEAQPLLDHATGVLATVSPRRLPILLEAGARCDLAAHRTADAIAKLERARTVCADAGCPPPVPEGLAWRLGKTLVESRRDRAGGMKLVDEAFALATEHQVGELVSDITAWRKLH